ncbi:hypothetical protein [Longimicrobium sp.]|uniref:hypothetical protein n=1 Tax=Longimicrobium sp. TaxID=2029185 RepID=UPI002C863B70|nr:hypothetical protein [Longimicrobium sp.]HSU18020.1 hypothetical protein [Longimicrobium sp.]
MTSTWRARLLLVFALFAGVLPGPASAQARADVLSGRVIPAGGGDVRGMRVFARLGALADSAVVDGVGRFAIKLPGGSASDTLEVSVDAAETAVRAFHPARLTVARGDAAREQEIVLVPLRWTIRGGRYAGSEVEVPLARAFAAPAPCAGCTGFFRAASARPGAGRTWLAGWPAERFPLRVAFDREWSGETVTARDSVVFWREADELERALGADVFRPANFADTAPRENGGPDDVILVWLDPDMHGIRGLGTAVSDGHEIGYGDLRLSRGALRDPATSPGLVAHELMHTLGFGHTCAWRSVLSDVRRCPELRAPTATEEDVAYVELAAEVRALVRQRGGRWALEAALAAMDAPGERGLAAR